jgi:hypothetical protein
MKTHSKAIQSLITKYLNYFTVTPTSTVKQSNLSSQNISSLWRLHPQQSNPVSHQPIYCGAHRTQDCTSNIKDFLQSQCYAMVNKEVLSSLPLQHRGRAVHIDTTRLTHLALSSFNRCQFPTWSDTNMQCGWGPNILETYMEDTLVWWKMQP